MSAPERFRLCEMLSELIGRVDRVVESYEHLEIPRSVELLARLFKGTAISLGRVLNDNGEPDIDWPTTMQACKRAIEKLSYMSRYLETAGEGYCPYLLSKHLEGLVENIASGALVALRVQNRFTYDISKNNIIKEFSTHMRTSGVPNEQVQAITTYGGISDLRVLSVPKLWDKNCLFYPIMVHEIGHLVLGQKEIYEALERHLNEAALTVDVRRIVRAWTEEYLCDYIAYMNQGPAYLFALTAFFSGTENFPLRTHPPEIHRLRRLHHDVHLFDRWPDGTTRVRDALRAAREGLPSRAPLSGQYGEAEKTCKDLVSKLQKRCKGVLLKAGLCWATEQNVAQTKKLLLSIENAVLPCEVIDEVGQGELHPKHNSPDWRNILNSCWLHVIGEYRDVMVADGFLSTMESIERLSSVDEIALASLESAFFFEQFSEEAARFRGYEQEIKKPWRY